MAQLIEQGEILVLLLVHLLLGARSLVLLTAEVQNTMNNDAQHLLARCGTIESGIVAHGLDVDEDIARDVALLEVAVVEGYDVGEVVVPEELDVHRAMTLRRAE